MKQKRMKSNFRGEKIRVVKNRSHSNPDKYYETIQWGNGDLTCNCRGWILPKNGNPRTCRHVKSLEQRLSSRVKHHSVPLQGNPVASSGHSHESRIPIGEISHDGKSWEPCFPEGRLYTPPVVTPKKYYRMIRVAE